MPKIHARKRFGLIRIWKLDQMKLTIVVCCVRKSTVRFVAILLMSVPCKHEILVSRLFHLIQKQLKFRRKQKTIHNPCTGNGQQHCHTYRLNHCFVLSQMFVQSFLNLFIWDPKASFKVLTTAMYFFVTLCLQIISHLNGIFFSKIYLIIFQRNFHFPKWTMAKCKPKKIKPVDEKGVVFVDTIQQRLNAFQLRRSLFYSSKI